jgi:hypothetical protein
MAAPQIVDKAPVACHKCGRTGGSFAPWLFGAYLDRFEAPVYWCRSCTTGFIKACDVVPRAEYQLAVDRAKGFSPRPSRVARSSPALIQAASAWTQPAAGAEGSRP